MKYEEYKDSDVQWIGEVPSHWEMCRFKNFTSLQTLVSDNKNKIGLENIEGKTGRYIESSSEFEGNGVGFDVGDIIYGKLRPYLQKVWIAAFSGNAVGDFFVFRATKNCYNKYLFYVMLSDGFTTMCNGATIGTKMPRVSSDFIRGLHFYLPPLYEQRAIATYLDEKCGKINRAIDVQKKKIDLLNELKQTIITDAVTKGVNPNVPMKDSGVEWIGKIPEHWKIKRTRFLCKIQTGDKDTVNRIDDGQYPFYVRSPKVERIDSYSFDGEAVLMAGDGVGAGKVFHYANGKFDYHQRVYNLHNFKDVSGMYYFYYISNKFKYIIEEGAAKNTVDSVRLNMLQDFWVTIPPLSEQQIIVVHIEKETTKIDSQITKANRRIELLEELKQSIITEAVTGKIKVC